MLSQVSTIGENRIVVATSKCGHNMPRPAGLKGAVLALTARHLSHSRAWVLTMLRFCAKAALPGSNGSWATFAGDAPRPS
jgi:hypothetical protein